MDKLPAYGLGIPILSNKVQSGIQVRKNDAYVLKMMQVRKELAEKQENDRLTNARDLIKRK